MEWNKLYITDKNGGKHFRVTASPSSTMSEIRNLKRHIQQAKKRPDLYSFMDADTSVIMLNGQPEEKLSQSDEDLLTQLFNEL